MTADIHDIADQRPHLAVAADDGVHVIPSDLVRSVVAGDQQPATSHPDRASSASDH